MLCYFNFSNNKRFCEVFFKRGWLGSCTVQTLGAAVGRRTGGGINVLQHHHHSRSRSDHRGCVMPRLPAAHQAASHVHDPETLLVEIKGKKGTSLCLFYDVFFASIFSCVFPFQESLHIKVKLSLKSKLLTFCSCLNFGSTHLFVHQASKQRWITHVPSMLPQASDWQ